MWTPVAVILCLIGMPCLTLPPPDDVSKQPPAMTEEACLVAAHDTLSEIHRRAGMNVPFTIKCEQSS